VKQKHIVVVDGLWVGHHPTYVKTFVKLLLDAGYRVSVLCPAQEEVSSWAKLTLSVDVCRFKAHQFSEREPYLFRYMPRKIRHALLPLARWSQVSRSLKTLCSLSGKPDLVFFAWLDNYVGRYLPVVLIDWQFPFLWSGLYFHPNHLRILGTNGKPKEGRFALPERFLARSKWASSVAVLDAGILKALRGRLHGKQAVVLPDFTDELPPSEHYHLAEEIRSKARGRKIIGLLGALARRKGLLTLIRIVRQSVERDWYFVFAGGLLEQTFSKDELTEVNSFFSMQREECLFHLDMIPDDAQFNAVINVCDVIFAMYENFPHSSNLITKSAIYGKRVLVSTGGYMEEVVRDYELGESVPAGDIQAALGALRRLTDWDRSVGTLSGMQEYAKKQSLKNLQQILLNFVESSLDSSHANRNIATDLPSIKCNS
jgi:glycosyltransferase involved in cell wall biosynthesis